MDGSKPKEVLKPGDQTDEQKRQSDKVSQLTVLLGNLSEKGRLAVEETGRHKGELQRVVALQERLMRLQTDTEQTIRELAPSLNEIGLDASKIVNLKVSLDPVDSKIKEIREKITTLEKDRRLGACFRKTAPQIWDQLIVESPALLGWDRLEGSNNSYF